MALRRAHDWSKEELYIEGKHFVDATGRVCLPRGVNVAACSKLPMNFASDSNEITFVGRPFTLEEADEHLARLASWGFTFIRLLVTWEAIAHAGPTEIDHAYLDYLRRLLELFPSYGLVAVVSMHQDVWSRAIGGSGAPAWTLTSAGFDLSALKETLADWRGAIGIGKQTDEVGLWPTGYQKLACSTMFTLFWGGRTFAPDAALDGINIQNFLQDAFLRAWDALIDSLKALIQNGVVIGVQMMNEPHPGYIGMPNVNRFNYNTELHLGPVPSALQSFALSSGKCLSIPYYTRRFPLTAQTGSVRINAHCENAWLSNGPSKGRCIWQQHGVWAWDERKNVPVALRETYFTHHPHTGAPIDWYNDFYFPFLKVWEGHVRAIAPDLVIFAEAIPNEWCPPAWAKPENRIERMVFAPHWYDLRALFAKEFGEITLDIQGLSRGMNIWNGVYYGQRGARRNYSKQIQNIVDKGYEALGNVPVCIGEIGLPMDLNKGAAFKSGDWKYQERMADAIMTALESAMVPFTLWNYNPTSNHADGDAWNHEYFSIFSSSSKPNAPLTASIVRPYLARVAGTPKRVSYDPTTGEFNASWTGNGMLDDQALTEVFVPRHLYEGRELCFTLDGIHVPFWLMFRPELDTLYVRPPNCYPSVEIPRELRIWVEPPLNVTWSVNSFASDLLEYLLAPVRVLWFRDQRYRRNAVREVIGSIVVISAIAWIIWKLNNS